MNRSGRPRPELLMRIGSQAAAKGRCLSQFSHGLTGRCGTMTYMLDTRQDADLRIRIPARWPDALH